MSYEATNLHTPGDNPAFLSISMGSLLCFAVLITWGILLRKNMAAHRRIVLLANLSIAVAGFTRLLQIFPLHPTSPVGNYFFFFSGTLFIVLLMLFWDWKKNRVMKQFMMGTVFVVAVQVVSIILFYKPAWKTFAGGVIAAWGKFAL
jgi:predicted neutral ceramidase superfamily lipid hydrolase